MSPARILVYFVRKDLRISDNPILHHLATSSDHGFTHFLPVFVVPAQQMEVSGFLKDGAQSPYPEARSEVAGFWRTGPHRTKFISQAVWNLKENLEKLGSSLTIRAGSHSDVLEGLVKHLDQKELKIAAVWMTGEEGYEEIRDEKAVAKICAQAGIDFRLWADEKYFIDE
jgi:deoxyribodipyrimidine photo-lyase